MSDQQQFRPRLVRDDFIALRSLARCRWIQGLTIAWKFNRTWTSITCTDAALIALDRLIAAGLAEESICCQDCKRPTFQLTSKGLSLMDRIYNAPPAAPAPRHRQRKTLQRMMKKMKWALIAK